MPFRTRLLLGLVGLTSGLVIDDRALELAKQKDPNCECIPWMDAYGTHGNGTNVVLGRDDLVVETDYNVACGAGFEVDFLGGHPGKLDTTICQHTFQRIPEAVCVNQHLGLVQQNQKEPHQWCYVDEACTKLNGGSRIWKGSTQGFFTEQKVYRGVSWKVCEEGVDTFLRDTPPNELLKKAKEWMIDPSWLARYAYQVDKRSTLWSEALKEVFTGQEQDSQWLPVYKKVKAHMKNTMTRPMIIDGFPLGESGHYNYQSEAEAGEYGMGLLYNGSVWDFVSANQYRGSQGSAENIWYLNHPQDHFEIRCLVGDCL